MQSGQPLRSSFTAFDHGLFGEGELVIVHQDEAFLAKDGSDLRMFGTEDMFVDRARLAVRGEGAIWPAAAAMGLGNSGHRRGRLPYHFRRRL